MRVISTDPCLPEILTHGAHTQVSGYIDFAHRLKTEAFEPVRCLADLSCLARSRTRTRLQYFEGKKRLAPRASDLSYLNWETQVCAYYICFYVCVFGRIHGRVFVYVRARA